MVGFTIGWWRWTASGPGAAPMRGGGITTRGDVQLVHGNIPSWCKATRHSLSTSSTSSNQGPSPRHGLGAFYIREEGVGFDRGGKAAYGTR